MLPPWSWSSAAPSRTAAVTDPAPPEAVPPQSAPRAAASPQLLVSAAPSPQLVAGSNPDQAIEKKKNMNMNDILRDEAGFTIVIPNAQRPKLIIL